MKAGIAAALAITALTGCTDTTPVEPGSAAALLPCAFGGALQLEVGEVRTLEGGEAELVCLQSGADAGEYVLVPFFATDRGKVRLSIGVSGGNLQPASPEASSPSGSRISASLIPSGEITGPDRRWHMRLLERSRRELNPRIRSGSAPATLAAVRSTAAAVPSVGDTLGLNVSVSCEVPDIRRGRVAAVSEHAVIVTDVANPTGGLTDEQLRSFAVAYDTLIYPVALRNLGTPTDIDNNGRVIIFFTRAVNELTPPGSGGGYVAGFFWAGDLFPREEAGRLGACPQSNVSEIFYLLAADPTGELGRRHTREAVFRSSLGTIGHELEHLINAGQRLYVSRATMLEEPWLDEGLAHITEELLFYATSPAVPRSNIDWQRFTAAPVIQSSNAFMLENMARYTTYLLEPDTASLMGIDNLETRGASWAFLRYAADREPGPDETLFRKLVAGPAVGVPNLQTALSETTGQPVSPLDWMQAWTVSVYTDDRVPGIAPEYTQPSWLFRSIIPNIVPLFGFENPPAGFPLRVHDLSRAQPLSLTLRPGGASFVRFAIAASSRVGISVGPRGAGTGDALRVSLVRIR